MRSVEYDELNTRKHISPSLDTSERGDRHARLFVFEERDGVE